MDVTPRRGGPTPLPLPRQAARQAARHRFVPVVGAVVIGLVMTAVAVLLARALENARCAQAFGREVDDRFRAIERTTHAHLGVVHAVRAFYDSSDLVTRDEFETFVGHLLAAHDGIRAIDWVPRVTANERASHEEWARGEGCPEYAIRERGPDGTLVDATPRAEHFPILFHEPIDGNMRALGYDVASDADTHDALERAVRNNEIAATTAMQVVQDREGEPAVLVCIPKYHPDAPTTTPDERRAGLEGFLVAVVRVPDLLRAALSASADGVVDVAIIEARPEGESLLAARGTPQRELGERPDSPAMGWMQPPRSLDFGGQRWTIECTPTDAFGGHSPFLADGVLLVGTIVTIVLGGYLVMLVRHTLRIEEGERRLSLMLEELDHRVKNNFAIVMSIAEQTLESADSLEQFAPAFSGRIRSMALAHEMLAATNWDGAELGELVRRLLEPYRHGRRDRIEIRGQPVLLSRRIAPGLCMVLHELVCNAAKYGSLSGVEGTVLVEWSIGAPGAEHQLELRWVERGGPPVVAPDTTGVGTELIDGIVVYQLHGRCRIDYDPEGVTCSISLAIDLVRGAETGNGRRARAGATRLTSA